MQAIINTGVVSATHSKKILYCFPKKFSPARSFLNLSAKCSFFASFTIFEDIRGSWVWESHLHFADENSNEKISFPTTQERKRPRIYFQKIHKNWILILVICAGCQGVFSLIFQSLPFWLQTLRWHVFWWWHLMIPKTVGFLIGKIMIFNGHLSKFSKKMSSLI